MKKVLSLFAASLLFMSMLSSSNVNEVLIEEVELIKVDCYEQAFDTMEAFADAGFSEEVVAFWGEMAYCWCEPNCYDENDY